ncbi:ArsR/SmtB family transcription factor [Myceligenerans indicum]|uniref:Helix-turn-helix transcriptional regulator n=1 Tax=Myceligenerans indicum TaxID=2593663 RepID=A0ABS1LJL4_9MICO|nr:metalloregulator ArsR/SmtB family transcription factor [Myceligenerans indicum]MBL0886402.1 helix-turn-helix transcriptional regulator [Myceligenerans indicum]
MTATRELLPTVAPPSGACCAPMVREAIDPEPARELAHAFKALSDPARVQLVSIIAAHDGGGACVCDLTEPVGLSQPTVSHHLKILVEAGFLTRTQRGKWGYYAITPGSLDRIAESLTGASPLGR